MMTESRYYKIAFRAQGVEMAFDAPSPDFAEKQLNEFMARMVEAVFSQPIKPQFVSPPIEQPMSQSSLNVPPTVAAAEPITPSFEQPVENEPIIFENPITEPSVLPVATEVLDNTTVFEQAQSLPVENLKTTSPQAEEIQALSTQIEQVDSLDSLLDVLKQDITQQAQNPEPTLDTNAAIEQSETALNAFTEELLSTVPDTPITQLEQPIIEELAVDPIEEVLSPKSSMEQISLPFEKPAAPLQPEFQAALEEALQNTSTADHLLELTANEEPEVVVQEEVKELELPFSDLSEPLSKLDELIPTEDDKVHSPEIEDNKEQVITELSGDDASELTQAADSIDISLDLEDLKNLTPVSGSVFEKQESEHEALEVPDAISTQDLSALSALDGLSTSDLANAASTAMGQGSVFDSAFSPSSSSTTATQTSLLEPPSTSSREGSSSVSTGGDILPPRKLDEVETLQELFELTPNAVAGEDFLLLSAYFLSCYRNLPKFSLKEVNLELIRSGLTPVNHTILEQVVEKNWFEVLPHSGDASLMTQYAITEAGQIAAQSLM